MKFKSLFCGITSSLVGLTISTAASGQFYASPTPHFRVAGKRVEIKITEALGSNPPQVLLLSLQKYPKKRLFHLTFESSFTGTWGGVAFYDRQTKSLRLKSKSSSAEQSYYWEYFFKNVSAREIQKIAQIKRAPNEGSPLGYFDELESLGCPTIIKKSKGP